MNRFSKQNQIRIKYSLLMSPALFYSIGIAIFVLERTQSQWALSRKINTLLFPLCCIHILCWGVVLFVVLIYGGILFPCRPHPGFAFGWSVALVFLGFLGVFAVRNFVASTIEYEARMTRFSLVTKYQRLVTTGQLNVLYHSNSANKANDALQTKEKCCGLKGYQDYNRASGRFDAINADTDKLDSRFVSCKQNITWDAYLRNKESDLTTRIRRLPTALALEPDEDVPISCCKTIEPDCNKRIFDGHISKLDKIFTKGCSIHLTKHIHACHDDIILTLLFSLPWVVLVYTCVVTWAHLRECQNLKFWQCGTVYTQKPEEEDAEPNPPSVIPDPSTSTVRAPAGGKTMAITKSNKDINTKK